MGHDPLGVWRIFCFLMPGINSKVDYYKGRRFVIIACRVAICVCGVITTIGIWLPDYLPFVFRTRPALVIYVSVFVFTIGCLNNLNQTFVHLRLEKEDSYRIVFASLVVVAIFMIVATLNQFVSLIAGIVSSICVSFYRSGGQNNFDLQSYLNKHPKHDKAIIFLGCAFFAFAGLYADEIGSTPIYFDFVDAGRVFFGLFCVVAFIFLFHSLNNAKKRIITVSFSLVFFLTCILCKAYFGLPVIFMVLFTGMIVVKLHEGAFAFSTYLSSFGFGALAAYTLVEAISYSLTLNNNYLEIHDDLAFEDLLKWDYLIIGIFLFASILVAVLFCLRLFKRLGSRKV